VGVLKRAVLDEQGKSVALEESLQARELSVRKLEQENDSLTFRNKQLQKRIQVLQEDAAAADAAKHRSKGSRGHQQQQQADSAPGEPASAGGNFDYELLSKIEENLKLQQQVLRVP
jgi:protein phosphatase 1 regulatory subunit 21